MPSPFPGMDPYLEKRTIWPGVHQRLIACISETIQPLIRPKYIATIGERIQLAVARQSYIPDVLLLHRLREPAQMPCWIYPPFSPAVTTWVVTTC